MKPHDVAVLTGTAMVCVVLAHTQLEPVLSDDTHRLTATGVAVLLVATALVLQAWALRGAAEARRDQTSSRESTHELIERIRRGNETHYVMVPPEPPVATVPPPRPEPPTVVPPPRPAEVSWPYNRVQVSDAEDTAPTLYARLRRE